MRSYGFGGIPHGADGDAQNDQIGFAHGIGHAVAHGADQPALCRTGAYIGIGIPASGRDFGLHGAHRQTDRSPDQAQPDNRHAFDDHASSPHRLRSTPMISSI